MSSRCVSHYNSNPHLTSVTWCLSLASLNLFLDSLFSLIGCLGSCLFHRTGCVSLGEFEEVQNRRNKVSVWDEPQARHVSWKDQITSPQRSVSKPPKQRDSPHVPARPVHYSDSQTCPLVDRSCSSPSVLRKFCAMLQENEGKTLIEDGIVTTLVPKLVPRSPKLGGSRGSKHVTVKDTEAPATLQNWEHRGAKGGVKTSHWGTDNLQTDFKMAERILGNCSTPSPRNTPSPHQVRKLNSFSFAKSKISFK